MLLGLCFCLHNCSIHEPIARVEADVNWPSHPICLIVQHFHCSGSSCAVICNTRIFTLYDLSHRSIYISHPQNFLSPLLLCAFKPAKSSVTLPEPIYILTLSHFSCSMKSMTRCHAGAELCLLMASHLSGPQGKLSPNNGPFSAHVSIS